MKADNYGVGGIQFFFPQVATILVDQVFLIIEASLSVTHTHIHTTQTHHTRLDSSGRVISTKQRTLPDNTQHSQQTHIYVSGGIRTSNPSK
jgi:hypothetical protein